MPARPAAPSARPMPASRWAMCMTAGTAFIRMGEVVLAIESTHGEDVNAVYAIGPSIDGQSAAAWTRRAGHAADDGFVFEQSGKSTLRFRMRPDGGLTATWIAPDGKTSMTAHL